MTKSKFSDRTHKIGVAVGVAVGVSVGVAVGVGLGVGVGVGDGEGSGETVVVSVNTNAVPPLKLTVAVTLKLPAEL